ncbi:MAG: SDR family NAD(P)-dependent oxidoreductase [Candidatus Aminicenantes bacterium]|jgi:acyl transferase domain-containing protein
MDNSDTKDSSQLTGLEIAVIGMAGRFPGAKNLAEFWNNLVQGIESISFFSKEELVKCGIDLKELNNPDYVVAKPFLADVEYFDASFFGYSPREAEIMAPQTRISLECTWEALEDAGCNPGAYNGAIGVFIGASHGIYWESLSFFSRKSENFGEFESTFLNDKDFVSIRISYELNLKGPSFTMFTSCSTSGVAIHQACQSLLTGDCHMALAGGVSVWLPRKRGYLYKEGMILSKDGHCRPFDADASGTILGDGIGIVVLKPLEDALEENDHIYAVIKGTAINNDGNRKVGFTAPSMEGEASVIRTAHHTAGVNSESIGYIETHGTGTPVGDPIEVEALKLAFNTDKKGFCRIGSVKGNVGHLDTAAGLAGFIKTVLALKHRLIPPSLHFKKSNPKIDFENSPFRVNTELTEWKNDNYPLRAGASFFGVGGTNIHVVLEEAPPPNRTTAREREYQLFLLSAKTPTALDRMTENLAEYLKNNPGINLADAAYSLQVGRQDFKHRKMMVCSTYQVDEAVDFLSSADSENVCLYSSPQENLSVIFMFPGQGSQYVNMGLNLYKTEPVFCRQMDRCLEILKSLSGYDIKEILYPNFMADRANMSDISNINQTEIAQPVLFVFEYALTKLLMNWGIAPDAMIGHSSGEYAAACLAGVLSLEDALKLLVLRGKLMQQMPAGAMLGVSLPEKELIPLLPNELDLAAVNGPSSCVVSGPHKRVDAFNEKLAEKGIKTMPLHTSHAFHSTMMDPILREFEKEVEKIRLNKPGIPYISNVSGTWITDEEATNPRYWSNHLRRTVRFIDGVSQLLTGNNPVFVEVGPGNVLGTLVNKIQGNKTRTELLQGMQKEQVQSQRVVSLVRHPQENVPDNRFLLDKLGRLWLYGKKINWQAFYSQEEKYRIPLPTYPFERQYYWIEGNLFQVIDQVNDRSPMTTKRPDIADWFYIPSWKQVAPINSRKSEMPAKSRYIIFLNDNEFCARLGKHLRQAKKNPILVKVGPQFSKESDHLFIINPGERDHYNALFQAVLAQESTPLKIIHLWGMQQYSEELSKTARVDKAQLTGFYSLVYLSQVLGKLEPHEPIHINVVTDGIHDLTGGEVLSPEKAMVLGPVITINQESPGIICRSIDVTPPRPGHPGEAKLVRQLLAEFESDSTDIFVAYRNNHRWLRRFEPVKPGEPSEDTWRLRKNGVYLITGGFGGIGFMLARNLARRWGAKLVLTGRSSVPPEAGWDQWLETHDTNDPVSVKIKKMLELRELGGEVLAFSADAADREKMEQVVRLSEERFGPLNGVIHAAGIVGENSFFPLNEINQSTGQQQFQAKVHGVLTLEAVLRDKDLDFCLFMSSISSLLGGLGLTAYAAANIFMDTFAARHNRESCTNWLSVNWDLWYQNQTENDKLVNTLLGDFGITPEEGINTIHRILSMDYRGSQLIISTGDLLARVEKWVKAKAVKEDKNKKIISTGKKSFKLYKPPRNQVERVLIDIIQDYFGYEKIGIHDNFFDLGANSLDLVQINGKVNAIFENKIPLVKLFTFNSVSSFATYIMEEVLRSKAPGSQKEMNRSAAIQRGKKDMQKKSNKRRMLESK